MKFCFSWKQCVFLKILIISTTTESGNLKFKTNKKNSKPLANNEKAAWTKLVPVGVNLKVDEKSFILYWRDANSKVNIDNIFFSPIFHY